MSTANIPFTLTVAGQDAAFTLGAIDLNVTHVQLGSGNRTPNGNEVALVAPQEYAVISGHTDLSAGQNRIAATVVGSVANYQISEIGLWSGVPGAGGSVLVFYWALPSSYIAVKSASIDFNFESDLFFGGVVPSNITIVADSAYNSLAILSGHNADPDAHPIMTTPPLGDNDKSPANTEWVQQTLGKLLTKSVAGNSNVTLNAVEAGHGILKFTGALTGNINVIVPASPSRPWIVDNATTGGFTLTVKTAAGTGAICSQGYKSDVYSDGTNVNHRKNGVETPASSDNSKALISSLWAKVGLSYSITSNGYVKFPDWLGGWIIAWGAAVTSASAGVEVTHPVAFSIQPRGSWIGGSSTAPVTVTTESSGTPGASTIIHGWLSTTGARSAFNVLYVLVGF